MTVLHIKKGDLDSARDTALQATAINPLCPTDLFRLSSIYSHERDYANAHLYYERAVSVLPPSEQAAYTAKLARLKQHAADMTKGYSADPFDVLPLEVLIQVLQFGLIQDPDFALRASWVNRTWNVVITNCKELWKTLVFTAAGVKKASCEAKLSEWKKRAGGKIDGRIEIKGFQGFTTIDKFTRSKARFMGDAKELDVQVASLRILERLAVPLRDNTSNIINLRIDGGYSTQSPHATWPQRSLTCGIIIEGYGRRIRPALAKLESIEIIDVGYRSSYGSSGILRRVDEPAVVSYPALKRLTLKQCKLDNVYANTGSDLNASPFGKRYRADVLHLTLSGSPVLEYVDVSMNWKDCHGQQTPLDTKFAMPSLTTAKIHPPSIHCIDIDVPNLETLAYTLPFGFTTSRYNNRHSEAQPMIPAVADSLVAADSMAKLKSVEFACHATDDIARLENWISRLPNLNKLVLRNACGTPYPVTTSEDEKPDLRATTRVLTLCNDNPEICPSLRDLELEGCFASGHTLVEYVKKRKVSAYATLERISLKACSAISDKAKAMLEKEVGCFHVEGEADAINGSRRFLEDEVRRFEEDEQVDVAQAEWLDLI
jgi:hypothetical protein